MNDNDNGKITAIIGKLKLDQEKKEKIVIGFLLGVFLLLIASPVSDQTRKIKGVDKNETEEDTIISEPDTKNVSNDAYISGLENKLEQMIGGMDGAGRVMVMITLKDGGEKFLDKNRSYESIVVKERYPDVEGVVVLCEGGGSNELCIKIKEAVGALFSIDSHKIVVGRLKAIG